MNSDDIIHIRSRSIPNWLQIKTFQPNFMTQLKSSITYTFTHRTVEEKKKLFEYGTKKLMMR